MYCDRCGTRLTEGQRFCPTCGKAPGPTPMMPVQGRIAGHIRLLGILWLANFRDQPAPRLLPARLLPPQRRNPASRCAWLPLSPAAYRRTGIPRRRRARPHGRLGAARAAALGAHACHCARLLPHAARPRRHRSRHLYAVGPAARQIGRRVPADRARGLKRRVEARSVRYCARRHYGPLLAVPGWT